MVSIKILTTILLAALGLLITSLEECRAQMAVEPLYGAHAHNDYFQKRPLFDALSHGFNRVEVDVLKIGNELFVGHDMPAGNHNLPTFKTLYLEKLDSIIRRNDGQIYAGSSQPFYVMIDIKTGAKPTYEMIISQLKDYNSWARSSNKLKANSSASNHGVVFMLSGNRPVDLVISDPDATVVLDGRPSDLGKGYSKWQMPLVSQAYRRYSNWDGTGDMPVEDQNKIRELSNKVHGEGKLLRLWAHPENETVWRMLQSLGVDVLNVDDLASLRDYLLMSSER